MQFKVEGKLYKCNIDHIMPLELSGEGVREAIARNNDNTRGNKDDDDPQFMEDPNRGDAKGGMRPVRRRFNGAKNNRRYHKCLSHI